MGHYFLATQYTHKSKYIRKQSNSLYKNRQFQEHPMVRGVSHQDTNFYSKKLPFKDPSVRHFAQFFIFRNRNKAQRPRKIFKIEK